MSTELLYKGILDLKQCFFFSLPLSPPILLDLILPSLFLSTITLPFPFTVCITISVSFYFFWQDTVAIVLVSTFRQQKHGSLVSQLALSHADVSVLDHSVRPSWPASHRSLGHVSVGVAVALPANAFTLKLCP